MFETIDKLFPLLSGGSEVVIIIVAVVLGMRIYAGAVEKANKRYEKTASEATQELARYKEEATIDKMALRQEMVDLRAKTDAMWLELVKCREESSKAAIREARLMARIRVLEVRLNDEPAPLDDELLL